MFNPLTGEMRRLNDPFFRLQRISLVHELIEAKLAHAG